MIRPVVGGGGADYLKQRKKGVIHGSARLEIKKLVLCLLCFLWFLLPLVLLVNAGAGRR